MIFNLGTYLKSGFHQRIINVKYFILLPSVNYVGRGRQFSVEYDVEVYFIFFRVFKWVHGEEQINYIKIIDFSNIEYDMPLDLNFFCGKD